MNWFIHYAIVKCKQEIDRVNAVELLKKVNKFTEIFWSTKNIETEKKYYPNL